MQIFIPGIPVPKGSAKAWVNRYTGRAQVTQDNRDKQKPWVSAIQTVIMQHELHFPCKTMAVAVGMQFLFPRPKSHLTSKGALRKGVSPHHVKKPDVDKLTRCVLDALTGIVYTDDSQVAWIKAKKRYAKVDERSGMWLTVEGVEYE